MPRSQKGTNNPSATLNDIQIETIRRLYKERSYSQIALGITFGVHQGTISKIINRKRWS